MVVLFKNCKVGEKHLRQGFVEDLLPVTSRVSSFLLNFKENSFVSLSLSIFISFVSLVYVDLLI